MRKHAFSARALQPCRSASLLYLLTCASGTFLAHALQIPKKGIAEYGTCQANLAPLLEDSTCVTIEKALPFGLNAEPVDGRVVVKKDGDTGEKQGDVLRFFSAWKVSATGDPVPQPEMVDVEKVMFRTQKNGERIARSKAEGFDKIVEKLCSNDGTHSTSMMMVFERPL